MPSTKLNEEIKTILITGGTGLVGTTLSRMLHEKGYTVTHLSRSPYSKTYKTFRWDVKGGEIDEEAITSADAIMHLAGAGVADKRWSDSWKREIYNSRIDSTRLLREKVYTLNSELKFFLSASAIGYYGWDSGEELMDEESKQGQGFLADVVKDWEAEVHKFDELGIPNGLVRIGIVLSEQGGALTEMAKPIKYGIGAPLGSGKQFMSWIHLEDLCGIFIYMLENSICETINAVAPTPVRNAEFTKQVAKQLNRPLWLPNVPKFALKLIIGEMADILVGGNRVSSKKIESRGFKFQFPTLDKALEDLLQ
ncbi:MAG: TIGR01777 family oxidoreductase [Ekhidna sp.]